jgi:hypothetical protein
VARVDLTGTKDYRRDFGHAAQVIRDELVARGGEFDVLDHVGPLIDITFEDNDDDI